MEDAPASIPFYSVVHRHPVVLAAADWEVGDRSGALWSTLAGLPHEPCHLLVQPSWVIDESFPNPELRRAIDGVGEHFEHVIISLLAPTKEAFERIRDHGMAAVYCSQNALVREDIFYPMPARVQWFDALYDAKWADYKRHHLAADVGSLAMLSYQSPEACSLEYYRTALAAVRHAKWFTRPWVADDPFLTPSEVNAVYNQCRVGLCLSAEEGPSYASIQYLLSGLPVVTTANVGGRDEFLSPRTARWVDDDPQAVAEAVGELCADPIDPLAIRADALARVGEHRERFRHWMCKIVDRADERSRVWQARWPADLPHKLADIPPGGDTVGPRVVITENERQRFDRDGFLVIDRPLVTADELASVRAVLDDLLAHFDDLPDDVAYDLGDVKVHHGRPQIPEINSTLELDTRLGQSAAFARCQELAHQLLSGRAVCNFDHAIFKPPRGDTAVHWHQDVAYAPDTEFADEVHIWLALQDVDEANGCMRFVPTGGHQPLLAHRPRGGSATAHALVAEHVDATAAVSCPLGAGMATVHKPATLHSTAPNTTDDVRAAWILHFSEMGASATRLG